MLREMGWLLHETPVCVRILRPARFLRLNRQLRSSPWRRLLLDALAVSGVGALGIGALHALQSIRSRPSPAQVEVIGDLSGLGEEIWERCAGSYSFMGVRDEKTMAALARAARAGLAPHPSAADRA